MSSAGPFTATIVAASNLSVGSGVGVIFAVWAHLTASARFRARAPRPGIRPVIHDASWRAGLLSWFPVGFRPSAFASRSSCSRRGMSPPHGRPTGLKVRTSTGLPRSAHTSCDRGGRPLCPGDGGAPPDRGHFPAGACRSSAASPCTPRSFPSTGSCLTRHQPRVHTCSPVRSSPRRWPPGWNGPPLGFTPSFAPRRPGAGQRTSGRRQAIEHGPGTTRSTSHQPISNPVVLS
jgi:hypothetical protein